MTLRGKQRVHLGSPGSVIGEEGSELQSQLRVLQAPGQALRMQPHLLLLLHNRATRNLSVICCCRLSATLSAEHFTGGVAELVQPE